MTVVVGIAGDSEFQSRVLAALEAEGDLRPVPLAGGAGPDQTPAIVVQLVDDAGPQVGDLPASSRMVVCLSRANLRTVRKVVDGGADGVVWLEALEDRLAVTVRAVAAGQICVPRESRRRLHRPDLTTREKQVLSLVVMDMPNADIASRLFVTEATVKSHLTSAFRKLGVNSRAEAARVIADPAEGLGTGILSIT